MCDDMESNIWRALPGGDSVRITHEQLAATLRGAMSASPHYAPWAVPHVLESLAGVNYHTMVLGLSEY
jgi:hypothetical protein